MGAVFSCCLKGLERVGLGGSYRSSRRQNLQSLLSDRENPNVDGRKFASRPQAAVDEPRPPTPMDRRAPAGQVRSPATPESPTPYSPLNGRHNKEEQKRVNFGSFQQRSVNR